MILVEILPNLYLGDIESVKYRHKLNISTIINCVKDLEFLGSFTDYVYNLKKNIEKYEIIQMYQYLVESTSFIHKNIMDDKSVLVFCESGNQKASTVIAAYIIRYGKISMDEAINSVRSKNSTSFYPNIDYYSALQLVYNDIK